MHLELINKPKIFNLLRIGGFNIKYMGDIRSCRLVFLNVGHGKFLGGYFKISNGKHCLNFFATEKLSMSLILFKSLCKSHLLNKPMFVKETIIMCLIFNIQQKCHFYRYVDIFEDFCKERLFQSEPTTFFSLKC